ncbi:MAG: maleylpyruvate isomerase family mycothiol-dependent enzyme, partial [Acidimicrobiia bacterium]
VRHVARLAWRTLPYAFARAGRELTGPVAFVLRGPSGAKWEFVPEDDPLTFMRGDGTELCLVAARRVDPRETALRGEGPDVEAVLDLVRTYA